MKIRALVNKNERIPAWLEWRIINPYEKLRECGIDAEPIWLEIGEMPPPNTDILVIPRLLVNQQEQSLIESWFNNIKLMGTRLVFESDDDIWSESFISQMTKLTIQDKGKKAALAALNIFEERALEARWMLDLCDVITVSTIKLAKYVRTLTNKPVYVINNAIDTEKYIAGLDNTIEYPFVTIGYMGGRRALNELEIMIDAWKIVAEKRKGVKFVVISWLAPILMQYPVFTDRLILRGWLPTKSYAQNYQVDIGCCSVTNVPFCERKSTIKSWEYALAGALPIGTKTLYDDEKMMLTFDNAQDYAKGIITYIDDVFARIDLANTMKLHVLGNHNLEFDWVYWAATYQQIINEIRANSLIGVM